MSLEFYFDHNMPLPLALALRQRGIDILTAEEDGSSRLSDRGIWQRAIIVQRIVVTQDRDLLEIAHDCQAADIPFPGLGKCQIPGVSTESLIDDLELIATAVSIEEIESTIRWVPL